jgi:hypothetical protein
MKRKILFLTNNCSGKALVEKCGNIELDNVYCLNSISETWSMAKTSDVDIEKKRFYEYFD